MIEEYKKVWHDGCMNCDHIWTGRKGKTLDNYSDYID